MICIDGFHQVYKWNLIIHVFLAIISFKLSYTNKNRVRPFFVDMSCLFICFIVNGIKGLILSKKRSNQGTRIPWLSSISLTAWMNHLRSMGFGVILGWKKTNRWDSVWSWGGRRPFVFFALTRSFLASGPIAPGLHVALNGSNPLEDSDVNSWSVSFTPHPSN